MIDRKTHWENVYTSKSPLQVSWYQEDPALSLQLIRNTQLALDAAMIDVGGGASTLVDRLCEEAYTNIAVLDVSSSALAHARARLAEKANAVEWYEEDVTCFSPPHRFSLWHDRAVFHFLTTKSDRDKYINVLKQALKPDGHLIIMAFAIDGPVKCSGLDIVQYDAKKLMAELGQGFELLETGHEGHITPSGGEQKFVYFHFKRISDN
jgi:trans-aconitate methyltransferase